MKRTVTLLFAMLLVCSLVLTACDMQDDQGTEGLEYYPLPDGTYGVVAGNAKYLEEIVIPSKYNGSDVTQLLDQAFMGAKVVSITIPNTITNIGDSAFSGCTSLTSITLPDSVVYIGDSAFQDCNALTNITIPNSVTSIGNYAFQNCTSLTSIIIPDSVINLGDFVFKGCTSLNNNISLPNCDPASVIYKNVSVDKSQTTYGALALVNSTHTYTFPEQASAQLVNIWEYRAHHTADGAAVAYKIRSNTLMLDATAVVAMHEWLTDFRNMTGNTDVMLTSAYRTFEEQGSYATPQGKSDHHTGYGVTLKLYDGMNTSDISSNPDCQWLSENAYKYGFIVRYPEGKEHITALSDYTNYFHYVGTAAACYMRENNLCLEEFVSVIKSYSQSNPLVVLSDNGAMSLIYYVACPGDLATVPVPTNCAYSISGDNENGLIVTVSLSEPVVEQ